MFIRCTEDQSDALIRALFLAGFELDGFAHFDPLGFAGIDVISIKPISANPRPVETR